MLSLYAKWTVLPGNETAALAALKTLAKSVQEQEPDTWAYTVHTPEFGLPNFPTPNQGENFFFEVYKDAEAFDRHVKGPIFNNFVADHGHLFLSDNGKPYMTVGMLDRLGGFVRPNAG